jgi:signal transduction histidine kinase
VVVDAATHRIVQESITNVLRHSGSTEAVVEVDYRPDAVRLRITDRAGGRAGPADTSGDFTEKHSGAALLEGRQGTSGHRNRLVQCWLV